MIQKCVVMFFHVTISYKAVKIAQFLELILHFCIAPSGVTERANNLHTHISTHATLYTHTYIPTIP